VKFLLRSGVWRVLLLVLCVTPGLRAEAPFRFADTPGQLPKATLPRHYELRLQPDLDARTTAGTARIELEQLEPSREIILNALELDITAAALLDDPAHPETFSTRLDPKKQTLTLTLPPNAAAPLAAGRHVITISFRGKIGTQAQGFFVDKYPTASGDKLMLGTQMEPTDARRVFPCWDEPVYRATYDVILVVPEKLMAVANMPITRETSLAGGLKEVRFARTPAMASYLVALYAGEFEAVEGEQDGVKLRILTTEGKRASAQYALESTKRILAYYNEYFGVRYPLPKLDLIGVPNAFSAFGAMENWGCITYIDTFLLYDPLTSSQATRERVFAVIAHEMAHQWFGDLVTMAWWDNLWLNEGFASWMGTKCSDALNPDWQLWIRANADKERAMELDARKTTHPIQRPIANESQASDAFDTISYLKGQSFLRMLEAYLGPETFRAGLRRYVDRHQYSNTTTADLWAALGDASGKPVTSFAAGWTEQPGFPLILISATGEGATRSLKLEQLHFTLNDPQPTPLTWKIPVTYAKLADLSAISSTLLETAASNIPWPAEAGPVKANLGDAGYYRVAYDEALGQALRRNIATLPIAEQLNLLSDSWALMESGRSSTAEWLDLAQPFRNAENPLVLAPILDRLNDIAHLQATQPGERAFKAWVIRFLQPELARLGWAPLPGESPLSANLRPAVILAAGLAGDETVVAECRRRFAVFLRDPSTLPGDLRGPVLTVIGHYADRATYDQLHALARAAKTTEEKRYFYAAMQAAADPALARETLSLSLGEEMSTTESTHNAAAVAANGQAALAWDFAREHREVLLKQMTSFGLNSYFPWIANAFTDARRADELEEFVQKNFPPDALAEAAKTADRIRHLAAIKKRELPVIDAWVKAHSASP
jgi:aminopeptidase N